MHVDQHFDDGETVALFAACAKENDGPAQRAQKSTALALRDSNYRPRTTQRRRRAHQSNGFLDLQKDDHVVEDERARSHCRPVAGSIQPLVGVKREQVGHNDVNGGLGSQRRPLLLCVRHGRLDRRHCKDLGDACRLLRVQRVAAS